MKVTTAEFVKSVGSPSGLPDDGLPEIAFAGRSNVGKSSLLNRLLNRKQLAKTSRTPGKTTNLNYFRINNALYFVDLPGYGYARHSHQERQRWGSLIEAYLEERDALKGIVQLLDARHDPSEQDLEMLRWLLHVRKPFLVAATKADKLSGSRLPARLRKTDDILAELGSIDLLPFSATTGRGRDAVWAWIREAAHG
ncbi:MAG: ribosome biogenesis GTP-binding protein YihA/YsxC [Candidatus Latescibacteria bacterium]|jgi:GTP-binding protein|nr:ribosome biogenesis GTP-binding protein YihA/YsxC [Candidatus Latescibacterota bacterium]